MRKLLTLVVLCCIGLSNFAFAQNQLFSVMNGPTTIQAGEEACYSIPITWSSTTQNVTNGKVEIILPAPLSNAPSEVTFNQPPFVQSSSYDPATRKITWILENPFNAGSSATLTFCTKFPNGTTPNGSMVTLTPTFTWAGGPPQTISKTLTATATSKVKITKTILKDPALNNDAVFFINVENPSEIGNLDLTNLVITDPLPAGVNFVSASDGGTFSGGNVTWNIPSLTVGNSKTLRLTVQYVAPFVLGSTSTNTATLKATQLPGVGISASKLVTVSPPNPSGGFSKSPFAPCPSLGGTAGWNIGVANSGNVPLTDVVVEDMLPNEFFLNNSIYVGADPNGNPATVTVEYQTTASAVYTAWTGSPLIFPANPLIPTGQSLSFGSLGLPAGVHVTKVRFKWSTIGVGYSSGISMSGNVNSPDKLGGVFSAGPTTVLGKKITNTIMNNYKFNGVAQPQVTIPADLTIVAQLPKPVVSKSLYSNYNQEPGKEVNYHLCIANASDGVGNLVDPVIADLLPADVEYVAGSISNVSGPLGTPTLVQSVNAATGRPLLTFSWAAGSSLAVGQSTCFDIKVKIKAGAAAGIRSNKLFFLPNTTLNLCDNQQITLDVLDIDGDGITSETVSSTNNVDFNIIQIAAVASSKWVKGLCDAEFHRFPDVGKTSAFTGPGTGTFQYKLIVQNLGNEPLKDVKILDVLPFVGDVGVITVNSPRNTTYLPRFVSMDVVPAGITPKYSNTNNPLRTDLDASLTTSPAGAVAGAYTTALPSNLADVKSILFDFGAIVLAPGDSREIFFTMRVPYGIGPDDIAWNSFAHRTDVTPAATVPKPDPAEPIKVGINAKVAKIGDYVWIDADKNGIQNAGEAVLPNVVVKLLDGSGNPILNPETGLPVSTMTDASGLYCFGVAPGTYKVKFEIPPAYNPTTPNNTADDKDSDIGADGISDAVTVADGDKNLTLDAGVYFCGTGSIGDKIWKDLNNNGIQDGGAEVGVDGITLNLYKSDAAGGKMGASLVTVTTSGGGMYSFTGLAKGDYVIEIDKNQILAMKMILSQKLNSTADDNDNDFIYATGLTEKISIDPCDPTKKDLTNIDGAVTVLGTIGDKIWKDLNNNGLQDAGEAGVDGVTLNLYKSNAAGGKVGAILQTKVTSAGGMYKFEDLLEDDYVVEIVTSTIMSPMELSLKPNTGANDDIDSDFIPATGLSHKISIVPSDPTKRDVTNVDGGIVTLGSIGNTVWKDLNNNGLQDGGEVGVPNITMELYLADAAGNPTGSAIKTAVTDGSGLYNFKQLDEGMYFVKLITSTIMSPMELSLKPNKGSNDFVDSDFNPTTGFSDKITVIPNDPTKKDIIDVDAGIVTLGSIGDLVWKDYNNNGIQDGAELGVPNITMELYLADAAGNPTGSAIKTTTTDASGLYKFKQLDEGMYFVKLITSTIMLPMELSLKQNKGVDDNIDSDFNPATGFSDKITVIPNDPTKKDIINVDAGIVTLGSISDLVWKDLNNNGLQDAGEAGVPNITLELYLADAAGNPTGSAIKTATTDASGLYKFKQLDEGMYFVKVIKSSIMPTMEISKKKDVGANDAIDNDFNRFTGFSHKITVIPNDPPQKDIVTVDLAIRNIIRGTLGDYVWKDLIENGIQEACEKGVPNVGLELYLKDPTTGALGKLDTITGVFTPNVPMYTTTTNASGKYLFSKLEDETYVVKVVKSTLMANMEMSPLQNLGGNDALDNDFNVGTALSDEALLDPYIPSLRNILTVDAAIRNTPCNTLTTKNGAFIGTGNSGSGMLPVGNAQVPMTVTTTGTQILRSNQYVASTVFGDNCYSTKPTSGGYMTFRDNGGNGTINIQFGTIVSNPILFFKDISRRKLDLSTSVDANGNPICMRKISSNADMQMNEMMMMLQDNDPAQIGSLADKISQSCGMVQLIGDFSSINIKSSALNGAADNWTFGIASQDYNCGVHPTVMPLIARKKVGNVVPKDPANPNGNKIVTFVVEIENKTATKYNNLFLENYLDEKWGNAVVGITEKPTITWQTFSSNVVPNPSFNGTSDVDLFSTSSNVMMESNGFIRIQYSVEFNPLLINPTVRYENRLIAGSNTQPVFLTNQEECNLPVYLPISTKLPTNPVMDIGGGAAPSSFAIWLQCKGESKVMPNPICGKVTFSHEMGAFVPACGNTGVQKAEFMGIDECGNMYMYRANFTTIDVSAPLWDMLPMDKIVNCSDANAAASVNMWLNSGGGGWFGDPGTPIKPTVSSDYLGGLPNCTSNGKIVKFTVTDQCGNKTTATANLQINDNQAPVIKNVPADLTLECGTKYKFPTPIVEDQCGTAILTFVDSGADDCINGFSKTRVWTATDGCGNKATSSQTVFYEKGIQMKMLNAISDKIISCNEAMVFDTPQFSTPCSDKKISSSYTDENLKGNCNSEYEVIRHWKFWDNCGHKYDFDQTISILDNKAPVFDPTLPKVVYIQKNVFPVWKKLFVTYLKATDNCSAVTIAAPTYTVLADKNVQCTAYAKDQCGNLAKYVCIVKFESKYATKTSSTVKDDEIAENKEIEEAIQSDSNIEVPIEAVIYPNPTSRIVNVVPAKGYGDIKKIHIYNLYGALMVNLDVEGQQNSTITIDISSFPNATYIIQMLHEGKRIYRQVQKLDQIRENGVGN